MNAYCVLEARIFVDTASSIARGIRLEHLDRASDEELQNDILMVAVQWHGIELPQFVKILRDTWRRVWCHLIITDHDTSKALRRNHLFTSTISDTRIQFRSLLDGDVYPNEAVCGAWDCTDSIVQVITGNHSFHIPQEPYQLIEPLTALVETAKLYEMRHQFIVRRPSLKVGIAYLCTSFDTIVYL